MRVLRVLSAAALFARLLAASAYAAAPVVEETLTPSQISVGESAELRIKRPGDDPQRPPLPVVPGLEFRVVAQLQGIELVHGATLATVTTVVRVTPQIIGTFAIPAATPKAQPLMLRVNPANVGSPTARLGGLGETSREGLHMTEGDSAFIKLIAERREVYVGESVPISIELGARAGAVASMNGLPTLTAGDLTLSRMSQQPDRKETVIGGVPYLLLTWHGVLDPVKAGDFPLSVEIPLTIRVSTRPKGESQLEDQLGDPFMQRVYGKMVSKNVKAQSASLDLIVSPLPTEGRPAEFKGAVGTFKVTSDISSSGAAEGDPLTLRMHVTGSGDFDRVDSAMLEHVEHWKTYPPTSSFKASDGLGFEGDKVFEQAVIATAPGSQVLPAVTFAYFDPAARQYAIVRTAPLSVTISPSAADRSPASQSRGTEPASHTASIPLRPDHPASAAVASSLLPPYLQPRFLAIPSLLSVMFGGAWLALGRRTDPKTFAALRARQPSKAVRRALAQLELAARAGDGERFFTLARRTLQEALAQRWRTTPEKVIEAEVIARLEPGSDRDEICRLIALADEASYAGLASESFDFARWMQVVRRQLPEPTP